MLEIYTLAYALGRPVDEVAAMPVATANGWFAFFKHRKQTQDKAAGKPPPSPRIPRKRR